MGQREILSRLYKDTANVYRVVETENDSGISIQKRMQVLEDIPCSLSKKSIAAISGSDTSNMLFNTYTLFVSDEVDIQPSDVIHIRDKFFKVGTVFKYQDSHSEISLLESERV